MSVFDKILLTESFSDVTLVLADIDQELIMRSSEVQDFKVR